MDDTLQDRRYFEDCLEKTGWGLYHNFLLGLACTCNLVGAVTFVSLPLSVAVSSCDERFIPEALVLRIFTSYFIGTALGGFVAHFLADRYGRKKYLGYSLLLIFMATFAAGFAYNAYVIIGVAFCLGVGLESNYVAMQLLVIEVLPKGTRGLCITLCNLFWSLGYCLTMVLVITFKTPSIFSGLQQPELSLTAWRIMFAVCGGASLLLACACALIEESPRYFVLMGRGYLAYLVLKQMYAINRSSFAENFKVKEEDVKRLISPYDMLYLEPEPAWARFKVLCWRLKRSLMMIFSKRFCATTWILILLKAVLTVLGLFQLNVVLSKEITFDNFPNVSHSRYRGLDFVYPVLKPITYSTRAEIHDFRNMCTKNQYNRTFYKYFLTLGSVTVLGLIVTMFLIDRIGRRSILFAGLFLSGASSLMMGLTQNMTFKIVSSCIIMGSLSGVFSTIRLVTLESYPTVIRGTSYGATSFIAFVLAVLFINFIDVNRKIFTAILGIFYFCFSMFSFFVPELKGKPMVE